MSFSNAALIALYYGLYASQPLILIMGPSNFGAIIGLILGAIMHDPQTGVIVGAWIQIMYLGMVNYGGTKPSDQFAASIISIPIAIQTHLNIPTAMVLAAFFGAISFPLDKTWKKVNTNFWTPRVDRFVEELNLGAIFRNATIYPMFTRLALSFPLVVAILMTGTPLFKWIRETSPIFLQTTLINMGSVIPLLGFALFLVSIGRRNQIPFFVLGFVFILLFNSSILIVWLLGVSAVGVSHFWNFARKKRLIAP